jgi:hypothetical protein
LRLRCNPLASGGIGDVAQCIEAACVCRLTWREIVRSVQCGRMPLRVRLWATMLTPRVVLRALPDLVEHIRDYSEPGRSGACPDAYSDGKGSGKRLAIPWEISYVALLGRWFGVPEREAWDWPVCRAAEMVAAVSEMETATCYVTDASWARHEQQKRGA